MKKIVLVPLDERPCTYDYPNMLASLANDIDFVEVPRNLMGDLKIKGNIEGIDNFLYENCKDADYAVVAIDTLLYGGIVPSRLHYDNLETLNSRLDILKKIKDINPNIKLYCYQLIMRCPSYNGNDEEPDYYALCGLAIHMIGHYTHKKQIAPLTAKEQADFDKYLKFMENNGYNKYLDDYTNRRRINATMNINVLDYVKKGIIDFLIIPQDDSAPYGYTALDQIKIRKEINDKQLGLKTIMYPDADAVSNVLLARCINEIHNVKPKIFVRYNSCNEGNLIPDYEDRPVSESIKYQIMASGGMQAYDYSTSDIVLMVNIPQYGMIGSRHLYDAIKQGAEGMFMDRYEDEVKVYSIGNFSKEICGGPHVEHTGVLGHFKIKKEEASSAGVRRIKAILE